MSDEELKIEILRILACCAETGNNLTEAIETLKNGKTEMQKQRITDFYRKIIYNPEPAVKKLLKKYYEKVLHNDDFYIDCNYGLLMYYKENYYIPQGAPIPEDDPIPKKIEDLKETTTLLR